MTTGKIKRRINRHFNPYYGRHGTGWAHPKRAIYNRYYYRHRGWYHRRRYHYYPRQYYSNSIKIRHPYLLILGCGFGFIECEIHWKLILLILVMSLCFFLYIHHKPKSWKH